MDQTPNLDLPYMMPQQALKYVTHNEALAALDTVVQLSVGDRDLASPPATPGEGERYIVAAGATGAWSGWDLDIAVFQDGGWTRLEPGIGWLCWVADEAVLLAWTGSPDNWVAAGDSGADPNPVAHVGVNATADDTNRLSVKSDAVLFSHDDVTPGSGDMRQVINKAAAGNIATQLFQDNWSGRAEFGLAGDDDFHLKVSPDGSSWYEAITLDKDTGYVGINGASAPEGPLHVLVTTAGDLPVLDRVDTSANGPVWIARKARGTPGSKTTVANGDAIQGFVGRGFDGATYVTCANLRWGVEGTPATGIVPTRIDFYNMATGGSYANRLCINTSGHTIPGADNAYTLGASGARWSAVWAANGTIQTSDRRDKEVVGALAGFALDMVRAIDPVLFRWKEGGRSVVRDETGPEQADGTNGSLELAAPGRRIHAGFVAQDVRAAMDRAGIDFGAWGLEDIADKESRQFLRPDQLIPVLWAAVQTLIAERRPQV